MGHSVTLGGDRLGSGHKQKVHLHGYERSTHDMGYLWRSTMSAGTLVPFLSEVALPGDTFDINLGCEILTHPTIGPLFGSYKVQLDVFFAPIRLYQGQLHNNKLGIGMNMSAIKLPQMKLYALSKDNREFTQDIDNGQINPSCIFSYLNIRGVGLATSGIVDPLVNRNFNAVPFLAYWDIYKNYYANKQEEKGAVIHQLPPTAGLVITEVKVFSGPAFSVPTVLPPVGSPSVLVPTNINTYIQISFSGVVPSLSDIIIYTTKGQFSALELMKPGTLVDNSGIGQFLFKYNIEKYGTMELENWDERLPDQSFTEPPRVVQFDLVNIDNMREYLLTQIGVSAPVIINGLGVEPYNFVLPAGIPDHLKPLSILATQEGLAIKTYQSDLFNNWLKTEWIDGPGGITEITSIDTSSGSFSIDTLNLSRKVYNMLNRIAVSGGTYDDWLDSVYDHPRYTRCESPIYYGGLSKELVFQQVVSNSASESQDDGSQPLGTIAGKGVLSQKHKGGSVTVKVDEPGYIIGIVSLTPRLDYSQGNKWDTSLETMDDFHKPALDEIGFQELITEQMAWWSVGITPTGLERKSAGKQPAWINYMTNVNQVRGNFAIDGNEMFMTLNRKYEPDQGTGIAQIKDMTTYVDPVKYNNIFAQTSLDAQNFWTQIAVDMTARRKMSAKVMPNL